jgi:hypothetical protein
VRRKEAGVVEAVLAYLTRALLKMSDNPLSPRLDNLVVTYKYASVILESPAIHRWQFTAVNNINYGLLLNRM